MYVYVHTSPCILTPSLPLQTGAAITEKVKKHFDETWSPYWHVVIGRNFGSFVNHETKKFVYFYVGDKAVMIYKAGGA